MALFDNQNTFYNSTWHQHQVPTQFSRPVQLNLPWLQLPNYAQYQMNYANPYAVSSAQISPNLSQPVQSSRPKYNYDDIYYNGEPEDKESEEYKNAIARSEKFVDGFSKATDAAVRILPALSGNTSTKLGNYAVGAGSILSEINNPIAKVAGNFLKLAGAAGNALIGSNPNEANIKAMDSAIQNRARQQSGDNSTSSALVELSQNNIDLINPEAKYYGSEGFLNKLRGVGKSYDKQWENSRLIDNANKQARNTELLAYKDYQNKMIRQGLLSPDFYSLAALGGQLNTVNKYNNGGSINTPRTHGGLFSNGLVEINNGGSHELNPYQGVQFGVDEYGIPNLVEEGETIFKDEGYGGPDNYSFSDRINFNMKKYGNEFSLGGLIKNKKRKKYTFADISKYLSKDAKDNPNNKIVGETYAKNAARLADIQEEVKAERMLSQMNPLDIMAALQQSPMGEQMMGGMQEGMDQQAMMEQQQPMMAAYGGKLFSYGGNLSTPYGNIYATAGGINTRRNRRQRRVRKVRPIVKNTTKKYNNIVKDDKEIFNLPDSTLIHNDLFGSAISDLIEERYKQYQNLVKEKKYDEAREIANQLSQDITQANFAYVNAARNLNSSDIYALQDNFNKLGLNKNVNTFLKENPESVFNKGERYKEDNPLDSKFGIITQNRYFDFSDSDKEILKNMGLNVFTYDDFQNTIIPEWFNNNPGYKLGDNDMDFLKSIPTVVRMKDNTTRVVRNPNYVEGGNEPEFIPVEQDIQNRFAPKDQDAATWWEGLTNTDKQGYYDRYGNVGDPTRTGVYDWQQIVNLSEAQQQVLAQAEAQAKAAANNSTNKGYFVPKPRNDWESGAALAVALRDYADAYFGAGSKPQNPGIDAAYSYLSKVGNIPMVRSHPTGTKMAYRPTDLNYEVNNVRNDTFGLLRAIDNANMNHGYNVATMMAALNQGRTAMGKAKQQAFEDNIKNLQAVLSNNNTIDLENAKNSLAAQTTNAQNLARARETQAQLASGLASQLAQNYNNWLNYRNSQSSGLAQMLYDMGYNKQILNLKDQAFLLQNQQPDVLNVAGVQYKKVNDQYT